MSPHVSSCFGEPVESGEHGGEDRAVESCVNLGGAGQGSVLAEPTGQAVNVGEVPCGGPVE
jgi:hypothetical protein